MNTGLIESFTSRFVKGDTRTSCEQAVSKHFVIARMPNGRYDLNVLARSLGISIQYHDIDSFDGCLSWDSRGRAAITVSTRAPSKRQRFTVAHELGHWLLQRELKGSINEPLFRGLSNTRKEVAQEEKLANMLAAELLMPTALIREKIESSSISLSMVSRLAAELEVSRIAMMRRIGEVSKRQLVYINIVPQMFNDLDSPAEVDDAMFIGMDGIPRNSRDTTTFLPEIKYSEFLKESTVFAAVKSQEISGVLHAMFDVHKKSQPIPNCDLLAVHEEVKFPN